MTIPSPPTEPQHTAYNNAIPLTPKSTRIYARKMSIEPPQRLRSRDIPQKHSLVPADADEPIVAFRDREIEDFVAVSRVGLYELRLCGGRGIEDADLAIGRAGQDLRSLC